MDVDTFWETLDEISGRTTQSSIFRKEHQKKLNQHCNSIMSSGSDTMRNNTMINNCNVIESDSKVVFNGRTLGSILKSKGKELFNKYNCLSNEEKVVANYCLNGILDLSNESGDSQKNLFSTEEWDLLKSTFISKRKSHKIFKELVSLLKKIEEGEVEKAYNKTLIEITKATSNKFALKVIAHVINVYMERGYIFIAADDDATECDYTAKIWSEVFELLFGDVGSTFIKWGESVSGLTSDQKKANDKSKKNVIGLKVDARFMANVYSIKRKLVDISNMEAAKSLNCKGEVYKDKSKLAIETKCILDNLVINCEPQTIEDFHLLNLQICGTKADVWSLKLVDSGVYARNFEFNLTLPPSLELLPNNMID